MAKVENIDLSSIPAPDAIIPPDPEVIFALWLDRVCQLDPTFSALLESDPAFKQGEAFAYLGGLFYQRTNDAVRAVLLASAGGGDLDQVGANFGVQRLMISPGDETTTPPIEAIYESDDEFRHRIQLSWSRLSTAGAEQAYTFFASSAHPSVLDVRAYGPETHERLGEVWIYVLSRSESGLPTDEVISEVLAAVNQDEVRPITDLVSVYPAEMVDFEIDADVYLPYGLDNDLVMENASKALTSYIESVKAIGSVVARSGIDKALHQSGVVKVVLRSPSVDMEMQMGQAARCTSINLSKVVVNGE